jgi:conjugal transfer pilus assembly protein TraK
MINKNIKTTVYMILVTFFTSCIYASTDKPTAPLALAIDSNSQVSVSLSKTDINRLYVHGEKITAINFPGSMLSAHNDRSGGIYVNTNSNAPFTTFISTNMGLHFSMLVIPKSIPGQTIKFIAPISKATSNQNQKSTVVIQHNADAIGFEKSAPYERTLIRLIKVVELGNTPPGYTNIASKAFSQIGIFNVSNSVSNNGGLSQSVEAGFLGGSLAVRVLSVKNTTSKPVELFENEFYSPGVRAIAIQQEYLKSNATTNVFEVISNV